jgi:hypothetical protein
MAGGSKSKTKGAGFERELGKFLGETFGGSFIRSNNSGAFIGGKNNVRKAALSAGQTAGLKGDLVAPDHMPKFVVEAKFYTEFRFHQLLQPGPVAQLDEWIQQCLDVVDAHDFWVIVFKINLRGTFVCVPEQFCADMQFGNHARYKSEHGAFRVTEMKSFFADNRDAVLALSR